MSKRNTCDSKEFFESLYKAGELPRGDAGWAGMRFGGKDQIFEEAKIKMVMKLRGLTREAAIVSVMSGVR